MLMMMLLKLADIWASPYASTFTILFFAAAFALTCCCAFAMFEPGNLVFYNVSGLTGRINPPPAPGIRY
jgi:hypothetical protein